LQGVELADLPLVQQQALGTVGVAVEDVALLIGGDVEAVGIDLAVLGDAEGILQVQRAGADGFDLRAEQLDAGLAAVLHKIVVERFAVLGGDLDAGLFHGRTSFPCGLIYISIAHPAAGRKRIMGLAFCRGVWYTAEKRREECTAWI